MRRIIASTLFALAIIGLPGQPRAEEKATFDVPGIFSIDVPSGGFEWKELQAFELKGVKGRIYGCTKAGSTTCAVLGLEQRAFDSEARKSATLKAHYNVLVQAWKKNGYTNVQGKKPALKAPIPARVVYTATATNADGQKVHLAGVTVFKRNVYSFQAFADTPEELGELLESFRSLKEKTP